MTIWDIILLIILALFIYKGIKSGFVKIIGSFAGIVVGAWAAGEYYDLVGQWLIESFDLSLMTAIVIAFIAIYMAVNIVISVVVNIITKVFRFIPLATVTNRLIGVVFGFLQGLLLIGLMIWVVNLFPFQNKFVQGLQQSRIAKYFEYSTKLVQPLLPKSLRDIDLSDFKQFNDYGTDQADYLRKYMPKIFQGLEKKQQEKKDELDAIDNATSSPSTIS